MLKFCNVTKSFREDFWKTRKKVLKNLTFHVQEGSLCGFLGANGSGKTTSLKTMLGFISLDEGEIEFSEKMGKTEREIKSKIGYFPERPYFYPFMTGREFCHYLGKLQSVDREELRKNIKYWSEKLNIDFALDQRIKTYSKGMLQRLGFVTALLHSPLFVVLDEPLSGLDPIGRKEFKDALVELNNRGATVFFSSHIVSDVEEICDALVVIKDGHKFFTGAKSDLLERAQGRSQGKKSKVFFSPSSDFSMESLGKYSSLSLLKEERGRISVGIGVEEKDSFLKDIIDKGCTLFEMTTEKVTLEEIVYDIEEDKF